MDNPRRRLPVQLGIVVVLALLLGLRDAESECAQGVGCWKRAEILLDMDGTTIEEAETLFGKSLEIARRQEAKTFELRAT